MEASEPLLDHLRDRCIKESFGMPQPAAALSITNMMNPHLFFSSSLWKLLTCDFLVRPPLLGGGVAATKPAESQAGKAGEEQGD